MKLSNLLQRDKASSQLKMRFIYLLFFSIASNALFAQGETSTLKIGDYFGGGIIFHIDESGSHGLIAALDDQADEMAMWGNNGSIGASSLNDGKKNTDMIIEYFIDRGRKAEKTAAYSCYSSDREEYRDWYLPAINELQKIFDKQDIIPNLRSGDYCSSTEYGDKDAWHMHFKPRGKPQFYYNKEDKNYYIRCIRRF